MSEENVKVAVRVRPFRERARNATLIVSMTGATTELTDPDDPKADPKKFAFDYSYWSHDGSKEESNGYHSPDPKQPNGRKFCDQKRVFEDIGRGVLNNAWEGFNSTLFAYGQTGSGKSWSVVGYGINKGIVPQFCEEMFVEIDKKKAGGDVTEFEVQFSMLEIYMEEVRDLLDSGPKKKGGLRVRQHPKKGFYVESLKVAPVGSYKDIENRMDEGTTNRTVAATNMNATSSRAHTIVGISLIQKFKNAAGEETTKSAMVNLVDLAGSERAESTGATGDRLKEGAAINQSLSTLGNVIAALADRSNGKQVRVPYRDSTLTMLLKNALGGNSKTIMIAAISPADINYGETLSTLRYADRAKQIKTKAVVNEDPTDKLIRELQEENEKLKQMLEGGGVVLPQGTGEDGIEETEGMSEAEKAEMKQELEAEYKAQLEDNAKEMEEMQKAFDEKLKAAQSSEDGQQQIRDETAVRRANENHMYNLNFDPQLSGRIVQFLDKEKITLGSNKGDASDIILVGPSIQQDHAIFTKEADKIFIQKATPTAKIIINGEHMTERVELGHNDRLMFGTTQLYVCCFPKTRDASKEKFPNVTFEFAQEEIADSAGFGVNSENQSRDDLLLHEDLADCLPEVEEANSISEDLDKKKKFELLIVSPEARGQLKGRKEVMVKMTDLETGHEWIWSKEKFRNRKFVMQELFQKFEDGEDLNIPAERDPFVEDPNAEIHIGSVHVWLQSLSYSIDIREQLDVTDYKGSETGLLNVEIIPCNKKGKEYTENDDVFVDSPKDLVGKDLHFLVKLRSARGLPSRFTEIYAKYKLYLDEDFVQTKSIKDTTNPDWEHGKQYDFCPATDQLVDYLSDQAMMIQIWGKQKPPKVKKIISTKDALQKQSLAKGQSSAANSNNKTVDANKVKLAMELAVAKKRTEKAEQKVNQFRELVRLAEQYEKQRISTKLIKELLAAPTQDIANKCLQAVPKEKGAGPDDGGGAGKNSNPAAPEQQRPNSPSSPDKRPQPSKNEPSDPKKSSTCILL